MKKVLVERSEWLSGVVVSEDVHFVGSDEDIFKVIGDHQGWIYDYDEEDIEMMKENVSDELDYSDNKDKDYYAIETGGDWDDPCYYTWALFTLEEFLAVKRTEMQEAQFLIDRAIEECL